MIKKSSVVTGPGKLTVGKLYGGILIYEIWKTTRFSNLEILAKMEQEMASKLEKVSFMPRWSWRWPVNLKRYVIGQDGAGDGQ
jgi:hypothetical protein